MNGLEWRDLAKAAGLPVFPIRVLQDASGKWVKRPLTARGHLDAAITPAGIDALDWRKANGYGAAMGAFASQVGWYCLDTDLHKGAGVAEAVAAWMKAHGIPRETRRHRTISGGEHLIYLLPGRFANLPSRANVVPSLDSRGAGGWVAFGDGYQILDGRAPATLPIAACEAILKGYSGSMGTGGTGGGAVELPDLDGVDPKVAHAKLMRAIGRGRVGLLLAWRGIRRHRTGDDSLSAADHAAAFHMALAGLDAGEIGYLLLHEFRHGVAARDGVSATTIRAVQRSAAKAVAYVEAERAALREELVRHSEAAAEAYLRTIA